MVSYCFGCVHCYFLCTAYSSNWVNPLDVGLIADQSTSWECVVVSGFCIAMQFFALTASIKFRWRASKGEYDDYGACRECVLTCRMHGIIRKCAGVHTFWLWSGRQDWPRICFRCVSCVEGPKKGCAGSVTCGLGLLRNVGCMPLRDLVCST